MQELVIEVMRFLATMKIHLTAKAVCGLCLGEEDGVARLSKS